MASTANFFNEDTHILSMLKNFQKVLYKKLLFRKKFKLSNFPKSGEKFEKNNRIFLIFIPKKENYLEQILKLFQYLRSYKINVNPIG